MTNPRGAVSVKQIQETVTFILRSTGTGLAAQTDNAEMAATFPAMATEIETYERQIVEELALTQGRPCDLGGYYKPNHNLVANIMRPSTTFNRIIG